jgi:hypothetical protein
MGTERVGKAPTVAAKSAKTKKSPRVFGKDGVRYSFPHGDQEQIQFNIDFSQIPSPPSYFYADSLYLRTDNELCMSVLSFGLRNENTEKFSQRIDVVMPTKSLTGPFWVSTRPIEPILDKALEMSKLTGETRQISAPDPDPRTVTLFANMIFLALGDGESTLDFYHLPPREVHLAKTKRADIQLKATVRVILSSVLTKHFFNTIRPYAEGASDSTPGLERSTRAARSR